MTDDAPQLGPDFVASADLPALMAFDIESGTATLPDGSSVRAVVLVCMTSPAVIGVDPTDDPESATQKIAVSPFVMTPADALAMGTRLIAIGQASHVVNS